MTCCIRRSCLSLGRTHLRSRNHRSRRIGNRPINANPVRARLLSKCQDRQHQPNPCHRSYPAPDHENVRLLI